MLVSPHSSLLTTQHGACCWQALLYHVLPAKVVCFARQEGQLPRVHAPDDAGK